jgi:hypothetical protein
MPTQPHTLKPLSKDAIDAALERAGHYRLLNEPSQAESICLDILEIDPGNQPVLVMLLLAITDQFDREPGELARRAREVLTRLTDPYQRAYYAGIIAERLAHAQLTSGAMHAEAMAATTLRSAMESFEEAERLRQPGNDDAILRWNTVSAPWTRCAGSRWRRSSTSPASGNDGVRRVLTADAMARQQAHAMFAHRRGAPAAPDRPQENPDVRSTRRPGSSPARSQLSYSPPAVRHR